MQKLVCTVACSLANASFLGFPVISSLYPPEGMAYAIVYDQANFLVVVLLAYSLILSQTSKFHIKYSLIKLFSFPAFLAVIIALFLSENVFSENSEEILGYLGFSMSPLAMLVVGYYIAHYIKSRPSRYVILAILYSLIITPFLVWCFFILWPTENGLLREVTILEAAMPPNITIAIILMHHTTEKQMTAQILSWGTIGAIATIPLWYWLLQTF